MDHTAIDDNALGLPPIDQIGFVVPDLDVAMASYAPLFGPWTIMDADIEQADYHGEAQDCKLRIAFGRSGDLEIELIQPVGGSSPHQDFIDGGGNGPHHVRYRTPLIDEKIDLASALGYRPIWYKRMSDDLAFCYLQRDNDPLIIEFLQMA
jgi:methylmalonyl-CoA/ethylmalonyl-CoA epimerase